MKRITKLFSLLLALVLMVSMVPMRAVADTTAEEEETATVTVKVVVGNKTLYSYKVEVGSDPVTLRNDKYIVRNKKYYVFSHYTVSNKEKDKVTIPAYDSSNADAWMKKWGKTIKVVYENHTHKYAYNYDRVSHWNTCKCGHTTKPVKHTDPATLTTKICECNYAFSNNADLTTLWLSNMTLSPKFNKETTEYTAQVNTYLNATATAITARSFDALATVELPANRELQEGINKFEIKVTAEDKSTTKTYTVIAVKPTKVENTFISADGTSVSAELKTTVKNLTATAAVSEAVADKMVELAAADNAATVALAPAFSKWSIKYAEIPFTAAFLTALSEKTQADLVVTTPYGSTLTIPHAQLAALAEGRESVTVRIGKDNTFEILSVGEPITAAQEITLTTAEA